MPGKPLRALAAQGLTVQEPVLLASQVWPAGAHHRNRRDGCGPAIASGGRRRSILAPASHPWKDALSGLMPRASWRPLFGTDDTNAAQADILLLIPESPDPLNDMEALATLLARIGALCLALEAAGAARITLAMSARPRAASWVPPCRPCAAPR